MFGKFPLSILGLTLGSILTIIGFIAYGMHNATLNLVGFFYGIPLVLGGLALKASELAPVPYSQPTPPSIVELREQQATPTQTKIRKDITRYCYGQQAHFDQALEYLELVPSDEDDIPIVTGLRETETDGAYTLILEFDSPYVPLSAWQEKQAKMVKYFGPDIDVRITPTGEDKLEVAFIKVLDTPAANPV